MAGTEQPGLVLTVVGTRPGIIKTAPILHAIDATDGLAIDLVHTNQHYDESLSDVFMDHLDVPAPDATLGVGSGTHVAQTAAAIAGIEDRIIQQEPDVVLAQGDTNAVLSAAVAASKHQVRFAHVEAGLRSGDQSMPEETNRVLADHVADLLFPPTETARENLAAEGCTENVSVTGNTVVDALQPTIPVARAHTAILDRFELAERRFVLATIHRPRNTDHPPRLQAILEGLAAVDAPVILPAHPRTRDAIRATDTTVPESVDLVDPLDYVEFIALLDRARVVVTDSGGVQEEAAVLETPCLTVRPNTERPETITAGVNELVEPATLASRLTAILDDDALYRRMTGHPDLYGDGTAGDQIAAHLRQHV